MVRELINNLVEFLKNSNKIMKKIILIILILSCKLSAQFEQWRIEGEMPIPVAGAEAVVFEENIFILGGFSDSLQTEVSLIQMFNLQTRQWQIVGQMLSPRMDFVADVYENGILYFGSSGIDTSGTPAPLEFWQFNVDSGQLSGSSVLSNNNIFGRTAPTGLIHNNLFYIFGGQPDNGQELFSIVQYDIESSSMIDGFNPENQSVAFPTHQMSEIVFSDIYIFGGVFNGISKSIYKFNTVDLSYELEEDIELLNNRADGTAVRTFDNTIVLIGGFNERNTAMREVERFYPSSVSGSNFIEELPGLNIARVNCMAVSFDDKIYVFGGFGLNGSVVKEIEVISLDAMVTDTDKSEGITDRIYLHQNYPNPFNPETTIRFTLNDAIRASLKIYSINGEEIKTISNKILNAGYHEYSWDGTDNNGKQVTSGVYIYRLFGANYSQQKKMLLLR